MVDEFTKYDHLFHNVKPNAVGGIKIFGKDDPYLITQDYSAITEEENQIWKRLFAKLVEPLNRYAPKEYLRGLQALGLSGDRWPNFSELSPRIREASGWDLAPVAGFLDEFVFFELNARRRFPVTDIIRQSRRFEEKYRGIEIKNRDEYTPEPDIFHDIRGHLPFLMSRQYGDFLAEIGQIGYDLVQDNRGLGAELAAHNLKRLQNFAWWTYEFGIMKKQEDTGGIHSTPNDMNHEIYGSGILSSYDEVMNVVRCSNGESKRSLILPFDMEEVVMTRFDYSDIQDRYYVIDSMDSLYASFNDNRHLFCFEG